MHVTIIDLFFFAHSLFLGYLEMVNVVFYCKKYTLIYTFICTCSIYLPVTMSYFTLDPPSPVIHPGVGYFWSHHCWGSPSHLLLIRTVDVPKKNEPHYGCSRVYNPETMTWHPTDPDSQRSMLAKGWGNVDDGGPSLQQHWFNVLWLLFWFGHETMLL